MWLFGAVRFNDVLMVLDLLKPIEGHLLGAMVRLALNHLFDAGGLIVGHALQSDDNTGSSHIDLSILNVLALHRIIEQGALLLL